MAEDFGGQTIADLVVGVPVEVFEVAVEVAVEAAVGVVGVGWPEGILGPSLPAPVEWPKQDILSGDHSV